VSGVRGGFILPLLYRMILVFTSVISFVQRFFFLLLPGLVPSRSVATVRPWAELREASTFLYYIGWWYEKLLGYLWCKLGLRFAKPIMWEKLELMYEYLVQTPKIIIILYLCDHAHSWHILFHFNIIIVQIILCFF
jgi:hypothetical protein